MRTALLLFLQRVAVGLTEPLDAQIQTDNRDDDEQQNVNAHVHPFPVMSYRSSSGVTFFSGEPGMAAANNRIPVNLF
jgi:hypothetical protein